MSLEYKVLQRLNSETDTILSNHNGQKRRYFVKPKQLMYIKSIFSIKFVKNRVYFSCFESRTGYYFKAFLGQEQDQAFGVPAAHPHPKIWGVPLPQAFGGDLKILMYGNTAENFLKKQHHCNVEKDTRFKNTNIVHNRVYYQIFSLKCYTNTTEQHHNTADPIVFLHCCITKDQCTSILFAHIHKVN